MQPNSLQRTALLLFAAVALATACAETSSEPARVSMDVVADPSPMGSVVTTDLGYTVEVTTLDIALAGLEFTTSGETEEKTAFERIERLFISEAHAHPGHYAGGEIIGELPERQIVRLMESPHQVLGTATLLEGSYDGANLIFTRASDADGLESDDPLHGHTIVVSGTATSSEGATFTFNATIDQDERRAVVGALFDFDLSAGQSHTIHLQVLPGDPFEDDTLFDGIDFAALDEDGDGEVSIDAETADHNRLRRAFQTHDFYAFEAHNVEE